MKIYLKKKQNLLSTCLTMGLLLAFSLLFLVLAAYILFWGFLAGLILYLFFTIKNALSSNKQKPIDLSQMADAEFDEPAAQKPIGKTYDHES